MPGTFLLSTPWREECRTYVLYWVASTGTYIVPWAALCTHPHKMESTSCNVFRLSAETLQIRLGELQPDPGSDRRYRSLLLPISGIMSLSKVALATRRHRSTQGLWLHTSRLPAAVKGAGADGVGDYVITIVCDARPSLHSVHGRTGYHAIDGGPLFQTTNNLLSTDTDAEVEGYIYPQYRFW